MEINSNGCFPYVFFASKVACFRISEPSTVDSHHPAATSFTKRHLDLACLCHFHLSALDVKKEVISTWRIIPGSTQLYRDYKDLQGFDRDLYMDLLVYVGIT